METFLMVFMVFSLIGFFFGTSYGIVSESLMSLILGVICFFLMIGSVILMPDPEKNYNKAKVQAKEKCGQYTTNLTDNRDEEYLVFTCGYNKIQHKISYAKKD